MNKYKIRILQLFFLLATGAGVVYYGFSGLITSFIIYFFLVTLAGNAILHRYYGHAAFEMKPWLLPIARWLGHHIGVGSIIGWTGHHRWHHQHSDTEKDFHSPTVQGIPHILFGVWDANIPKRMIIDVIKQPELVWWHKNYYMYHVCVILALAIISPWALAFVYAAPNLFCLLSGYTIAILPHTSGEAKNSVMTDVLTFGEGWHGYHHDYPNDYRFSKHDITAYFIEWFLKK